VIQAIICAECGKPTPRRAPSQKYCTVCSDAKDRERKRRWSSAHYVPPARDVTARKYRATKSRMAARGKEVSKDAAGAIGDVVKDLELAWLIRIAVPFDWAASKNAIYRHGGGHVSLREGVNRYRALIGYKLKMAMQNVPLRHNKLWIDLLIQKPNHKGDAVNFVDTICDAIKDVVALDDRWYAIRRLDWEIVKSDPQIFIGLAQEDIEDAIACSSCGRILPFEAFGLNRSTKTGRSRNCKECRK
jgi:hypothetical protein